MSLIPKGSFDAARSLSILKHLSIAGTRLDDVSMVFEDEKNVLYRKRLFFI